LKKVPHYCMAGNYINLYRLVLRVPSIYHASANNFKYINECYLMIFMKKWAKYMKNFTTYEFHRAISGIFGLFSGLSRVKS